jgi:hypothetical protein
MGYIAIQSPKMYDIKDAITEYIVPDSITNKLVYDTLTNKLIYNTVISKLKATYNESWKEIGAALQPTFQNGWASADDGLFHKPGFMKDLTGRVSLRGRVSGAAATGGVIFTLPAGYRPSKRMIFLIAFTNYDPYYLSINNSGEVFIEGFDGSDPTLVFQLDGFNFFPA